jgi:L-lactate dehydrogenase complex protein LldF
MRGLAEFQHLSYASSLCGNCTSVCPVKIDLAHHLVQNRRNVVATGERPWPERMSIRLWAWCMLSAERFKLASRLGRTMLRVLNAMGLAAPILKSWTEHRQLPPVPKSTFRQMWRNNAER